MRTKKTTVSSILIVLLTYVFIAGNTSGELALCIGANGHIAFEPLIHDHCHNHSHIEHDTCSMEHGQEGHAENPHCKPCIDIPIFVGPTDNRLPLKLVKPNVEVSVSVLQPEVINFNPLFLPEVPRQILPTVDENRFLRSVILLV